MPPKSSGCPFGGSISNFAPVSFTGLEKLALRRSSVGLSARSRVTLVIIITRSLDQIEQVGSGPLCFVYARRIETDAKTKRQRCVAFGLWDFINVKRGIRFALEKTGDEKIFSQKNQRIICSLHFSHNG